MKTLLALLLLTSTAYSAEDDIAASTLYCAVNIAYNDLKSTNNSNISIEYKTGYTNRWELYNLKKELVRANTARREYKSLLKHWDYKLVSCSNSRVRQLLECVKAEAINYNTIGYTASYVIRKSCDVESNQEELMNKIIIASEYQVGGL